MLWRFGYSSLLIPCGGSVESSYSSCGYGGSQNNFSDDIFFRANSTGGIDPISLNNKQNNFSSVASKSQHCSEDVIFESRFTCRHPFFLEVKALNFEFYLPRQVLFIHVLLFYCIDVNIEPRFTRLATKQTCTLSSQRWN